MEWLDKATQAILSLVAHLEVAAVVLGFAVSLGVTQVVKGLFTDNLTRTRVNLLAILLGGATCFAIFPAAHGAALRAGFAGAVGLLSPLFYKAVTWAIAQKWPNLANKASADL